VPLKQATPVGPEYALGMAWFQLGQVALKAGRHELMVAVAERAAGPGGRYTAGLDAVVFSRPGFQPKGIEKPNPLVTLAPPVDERRGSGKGKKQPDRAEPRERGKADRNESRDREKPTSGSPMR